MTGIPRIINSLRRGLRSIERAAGEAITYQRGNATASITGTRGDRTATEENSGDVTTVQGERIDWIITAPQLVLPSGPIEPIEGDLIIDRNAVKHRVTKHPLDGRPARWTEHRVALRIHTVVVS